MIVSTALKVMLQLLTLTQCLQRYVPLLNSEIEKYNIHFSFSLHPSFYHVGHLKWLRQAKLFTSRELSASPKEHSMSRMSTKGRDGNEKPLP